MMRKKLETTTIWPVGQGVKTPPFHGGNRGSNPLRVTTSILVGVTWRTAMFLHHEPLAQLVEHLTFNQGVEGSSPSWLTSFIPRLRCQ
ncbi:conserved protein of unknown function [Paenibacillus alvei]|uniref:Uncharacterized protein n=1 Tax=Paenibacillus alvei TaxID=44250 RepID=A0A383RH64_PAEAL|nr:conserved protein of unknown function [Paenibacillus alvei]